jgi:magnesium transporter
MEEQMLMSPSDALLAELVSYNSRLKRLRRTFGHQDTLLHELLHTMGDREKPQSRHEFQDIHEQMARIASLTAMLQELTRDLIDGYLSISAHRLNNIMKVLTIASVIFLPLSFIVGLYGMNFAYMPELQSRYGYFVVLGVLAALATGLLAVFRRLRWL